MKPKNKFLFLIQSIAIAGLLPLSSCKIDAIPDPNAPGAGSISSNATLSEIQNVVTGTEAAMRESQAFYWDDVGVIGREYYRFSTSDPRFTSDLLGKGSATLDNNTFYITNPFAARYRVVKNCNILISALTNTKAAISEAQRKVGIAYARTVMAHELLIVLNLTYNNGVRVDVADPDNLGPFLSKDASLDAILGLLNQAYTDLSANGSTSFPFNTTLYSKVAGQFAQFNRALAARLYVYKADWNNALTALGNSFYNLNGDLKAGVYYLFSSAGGDLLNPMFFPLNSSGETRVAHPSFVSQAELGDNRLNKVSLRSSPTTQDGLTSAYDFYVYKTNVDPVPIIRNEELLLIYAEAKAQIGGISNLNDAITALNVVRSAAGLTNYAGLVTQSAVIDEMLKQRRYALYGEGHRWIDMRRYNRLNTLPVDRTGDDVWTEFPKPATEQ